MLKTRGVDRVVYGTCLLNMQLERGIVKSQLRKRFGEFEETFGYETKLKREQILRLPKTHYYDAIAIACEEAEVVNLSSIVYFKKHVSKGDYRQHKGKRGEIKIPTGKLFGLRKFDYVQTSRGAGFIKGKRSTGFFTISDLFNVKTISSVNVKKNCIRLSARTTTIKEIGMAQETVLAYNLENVPAYYYDRHV
jgi:hypothetical protein